MRILLFISLLLSSMALAHENEWKALDGVYAITGADLIDPLPGNPTDTHLRIDMTGKNAKDLYKSMKSEAVIDECTGVLAKNIGQMQCLYYQTDDKYQCHFSINIAQQKIEYGLNC